MSKMTKFNDKLAKANARAAKLAKESKGGKGLGSTGLVIAELGSHAILTLASKTYKTVGPIPVSPDIFGAAVAGLAMAVTKKGTRKLATACLLGAGHAVISRMIGRSEVELHVDSDGRASLREKSPEKTAAASEERQAA